MMPRVVWLSVALGSVAASGLGLAGAPSSLLTVVNRDASAERVAQVREVVARCESGLKPTFPHPPGPLTILTYGRIFIWERAGIVLPPLFRRPPVRELLGLAKGDGWPPPRPSINLGSGRGVKVNCSF